MGVAMMVKNTLFVMLMDRATWFEAQWGQQVRQVCCAYESLRCLDVEIRQFFVETMTEPISLLYPL